MLFGRQIGKTARRNNPRRVPPREIYPTLKHLLAQLYP